MKKILEVIELSKYFPIPQNRFLEFLSPQVLFNRDRTLTEPEVFKAVNNISFTIYQGECVGLVGESGSGKSTLLRMISRLLDPTLGQIRFHNTDIGLISSTRFSQWEQRKNIQVIFQDPSDSLNPAMTALRSIAEPLTQLGGMKNRKEINAKVHELAQLVGLPRDLLQRYPHQLSGGQKARVGIARAIALSPDLLLLDEPTTALDVSVQAIILQLLDRLRYQFNMSYLFITHDLNLVRLLSDRILVMQQGQIVERGTASEIFDQPQHEYTKKLLGAIPKIQTQTI